MLWLGSLLIVSDFFFFFFDVSSVKIIGSVKCVKLVDASAKRKFVFMFRLYTSVSFNYI